MICQTLVDFISRVPVVSTQAPLMFASFHRFHFAAFEYYGRVCRVPSPFLLFFGNDCEGKLTQKAGVLIRLLYIFFSVSTIVHVLFPPSHTLSLSLIECDEKHVTAL